MSGMVPRRVLAVTTKDQADVEWVVQIRYVRGNLWQDAGRGHDTEVLGLLAMERRQHLLNDYEGDQQSLYFDAVRLVERTTSGSVTTTDYLAKGDPK